MKLTREEIAAATGETETILNWYTLESSLGVLTKILPADKKKIRSHLKHLADIQAMNNNKTHGFTIR